MMVSLKEKDNYDCVFLTSKGCSIYDGRPVQCRTYPVGKNVIESEKNWKDEGRSCPGIGKGRKVSYEEIQEQLEKGEANMPYMVLKKKKL